MTQLLTSDWNEADAITHGGVFHADDVFSTVLLHKLHPEWRFCRITELSAPLAREKLLYDIGDGPFDHHQPDFSESRPNGVKFATFGLLWRAFGMDLLKSRDVSDPVTAFRLFDEGLVSSIDAHDNGQWEKHEIPYFTVSQVITSMNPFWNEGTDFNRAFLDAYHLADAVFDRELARCVAAASAKSVFLEAATQAENGILVLPHYIPWQKNWLNGLGKRNQIHRIIYPSDRGGFCVCCTDRREDNLFPKAWAGLKGDDLATVTGIESAIFCHPGRFLCVARDSRDAKKLAMHKNAEGSETIIVENSSKTGYNTAIPRKG